jgi:uncharacterized membrane protein YoaK (UPF0700 family)
MPADSPERNLRLTALTGAVLLVLLAVEGFTLLSLRAMLSWHIFVGVLVVPVVLLKLGSTGYRFYRYYTHRPDYVRAGPPALLLRLLGPVVVLSTLALLATGLALIAAGPGGGFLLLLHKASFVVWLGALGAHVLGHLARLPRAIGADLSGERGERRSAQLRLALVAGAVVVGAIAALAVLPYDTAWLNWVGGSH